MRSTLFILSCFLALSFTTAAAKDKWEIRINKKVIFKGNSELENTSVLVNTAKLKDGDCITISYEAAKPDTGWTRTFYITDSTGNEIRTEEISEQSGCVSVSGIGIKEMMDKRQPIFIYTMSLPKDPELAARIRVRRVLLCKVGWN